MVALNTRHSHDGKVSTDGGSFIIKQFLNLRVNRSILFFKMQNWIGWCNSIIDIYNLSIYQLLRSYENVLIEFI